MTSEQLSEKYMETLMMTKMPDSEFPLLTHLLLEICDNDPEKFEKATYMVCLFLQQMEKK